jgi:hypothetical protein
MTRQEILAALDVSPEMRRSFAVGSEVARVSTGLSPIDQLLPDGGVRSGALIEWLSSGEGGGATTLALRAALQARSQNRPLVVVDERGDFYPPASGQARNSIIVIRPKTRAETIWAMEQVLRCQGIGALVAWVGRLSDRAGRRLQLAAERGMNMGMLIRPMQEERSPCWADARFRVDPVPTAGTRRLRVSLVRCRGGNTGASLELDIDHETGDVRLAPQLAAPMALHRAAGA